MRIEESATKAQSKIDSGENTVVGVNKFTLSANEEEKIDFLKVDNSMVKKNQIERLNEIKKQETILKLKKCLMN